MGWEMWKLCMHGTDTLLNGIFVLKLFGFSQCFWKCFKITHHKWILILCSKSFLGKIIFHRWFFHVLLQIFITGIITRKGEWLIKYHYSPTGISGLIKSVIFCIIDWLTLQVWSNTWNYPCTYWYMSICFSINSQTISQGQNSGLGNLLE